MWEKRVFRICDWRCLVSLPKSTTEQYHKQWFCRRWLQLDLLPSIRVTMMLKERRVVTLPHISVSYRTITSTKGVDLLLQTCMIHERQTTCTIAKSPHVIYQTLQISGSTREKSWPTQFLCFSFGYQGKNLFLMWRQFPTKYFNSSIVMFQWNSILYFEQDCSERWKCHCVWRNSIN